MTTPMIERVEAALEAECLRQAQAPSSMSPFIGDRDGDHLLIDGTFDLKALARAVIEAMRDLPAGHPILDAGKTTTEFWRRSIDAALKEE